MVVETNFADGDGGIERKIGGFAVVVPFAGVDAVGPENVFMRARERLSREGVSVIGADADDFFDAVFFGVFNGNFSLVLGVKFAVVEVTVRID